MNQEFEEYEEEIEEYDAPLFHPSKVIVYLLLASLVMIFVFLTLSYLYTRIEQGVPPIQIPLLFVFNSLILLGTSFFIHKANHYFKEDDTRKYKQALLGTILLTFFFMAMQVIGFWQLINVNEGYFNASDNARSYLQVISVLHLVHVLGGLPFLILFYITARKRMKEPVSVLVYFSDPDKRTKLHLLTVYWHFLDALWIYLVLFFWINTWF